MTHSNYFKEFIRYTFLNILGMLALSFYILADTFFIARGIGINGLTALNLAIPVYSLINGCGLMLGMGGAIKYAIYKSRNNTFRQNAVFTNSVYIYGRYSHSDLCSVRNILSRCHCPSSWCRRGHLGHDPHLPESDSSVLTGIHPE